MTGYGSWQELNRLLRGIAEQGQRVRGSGSKLNVQSHVPSTSPIEWRDCDLVILGTGIKIKVRDAGVARQCSAKVQIEPASLRAGHRKDIRIGRTRDRQPSTAGAVDRRLFNPRVLDGRKTADLDVAATQSRVEHMRDVVGCRTNRQ